MKKFLSIILPVLIVLGCCVGAFAAGGGLTAANSGDKTLKFNDDGTFKIAFDTIKTAKIKPSFD